MFRGQRSMQMRQQVFFRFGLNTSVSLNGSKSVPLSVASKWYLGQFNINYDLDGENDGKYLSEIFHVDHESSQSPVTWPGASNSQVSLKLEQSTTAGTTLSSSTSQASLKSEQSTTAVTTLSSSQPASPSPQIDSTPSSTPSSSGLKGGAVAAISVGFIVCLSLLILTAILFIRRSRRNRRSHAANSGTLRRAELAVTPAAFSSSGAATELAGNGEEWRELSAEQRGPRELPTTEFLTAPTELFANRI
ncbi:hypothetical protein MMC22_006763 [Lobaria immixta]|nr:hypothetical protein [Lobaria immixta]